MTSSTSPQFTIDFSDKDNPKDRDAILQPLVDFNRRNGPPTQSQPLALLLKSPSGEVVGGLWGRSMYDWLFVELLFIPEQLRRSGLGRTLIQQAGQIARERGCIGIWLDTFDFQARGFYQKLGFTIFGELKDHPRGTSQYWLQKRFDR